MPRKKRPRHYKPRLTIARILAWADEFHRRHGTWPTEKSGPIDGTPSETWGGVSNALFMGTRGLREKSTLASLLLKFRSICIGRKTLNEATIFQWAKRHFERTQKWPTQTSGAILDAPQENWSAINNALRIGRRGLSGDSSLRKLLAEHGIRRNRGRTIAPGQILKWADQFFAEHGDWPRPDSGKVRGSPTLTWRVVDYVLRRQGRDPGGNSSLFLFLRQQRGAYRGSKRRPYRTRRERRLSLAKITKWARAHRKRTGEWPKAISGQIPQAGNSTWQTIDSALRNGSRGLPGGSSLAKLFGDGRRTRSR
jgi:hypothetical protein